VMDVKCHHQIQLRVEEAKFAVTAGRDVSAASVT